MWKQCTRFVVMAAVLALLPGGAAYGAFDILRDPALVGWWSCDEGQGTIVHDSSANHRDGTAYQGSLIWGPGMYGSAIELKIPTLVQIPALNLTMTQCTMAGWIKRAGSQVDWSSFFMTRGTATGFNLVGNALAYHWNDTSSSWSARPAAPVPDNEWTFCAVTVEPTVATFYINGIKTDTNVTAHASNTWNAGLFIGGDGSGSFDTRRMTDAWLDDLSLWTRALTADEIMAIMKGLTKPALAAGPSPADAATDVPRDTAVGWTPGQYAGTHDVYFGTAFADVNTAGRTDQKGVLASQGQTDATFDPLGVLAYGQTYYWRIDEVNKTPDNTTFKGEVWSFTVEPYGYPVIPVKATASSSQSGMGPEKTIDGSGMTGDLHGTEPTTMWLSAGAQPNWIQYEFDKVYKLYTLQVWNSNQLIESLLGFGAKNVTVETSTDGTTWTPVADVPEFSQAPGTADYAANTTVNLGGVEAKFVKLTINANWGGLAPQTGLAEVRFSYVAAQAYAPQPATAATGVDIDTALNWRPGREAASHTIYFGTDPNAVRDGAAPAQTVDAHGFTPDPLTLGTTYYWRVDEVNAVTYPGDVWSFTTQEFIPVDDFESYTDQAGEEIFTAWVDGYATNLNGSTVGNAVAAGGTFGETSIIHGGKQSMPMDFDNSKSPFYSEAELTFASLQDWTGNGATHLSLWVRGQPAAFVDKGDGAFTVAASGHDIWDAADDFRFVYKQLDGDGSIVVNVDSLVNTNGWAKAGVMIRTNLTDASPMVDNVVSASNGVGLQYRLTAGAGASNTNAPNTTGIAAPQWVKLTRKNNVFTAQYSDDGQTWLDVKNPALTGTPVSITVNMPNTVYIGLCLTSHDAALTTTAEFSGVATTGNVTGAWQQVWIGDDPDRTMDLASLYLIVEDSAGKSATATNATIANATAWTQWSIPFSDLTGVNVAKVKKLTIGVGDRNNPTADGSGRVYIDDIGFGKPAQ